MLAELGHGAFVYPVGEGEHDDGLWLQRAEGRLQLLQHPPPRARLDQRPVVPVELVHRVPAAAPLQLSREIRGEDDALGLEGSGQPVGTIRYFVIAKVVNTTCITPLGNFLSEGLKATKVSSPS